MSRLKIKKRLLITIYSICVSLLFVILAISYQQALYNMNVNQYLNQNKGYYPDRLQSQQEQFNILTNKYSSDVGRYYEVSKFKDYFQRYMLQRLLPITLCVCLLLLVSSSLLWKLLKKLQNYEYQKIASEIRLLPSSNQKRKFEPVFKEAFDEIRNHYHLNMEEDRRQNAYISHELRNSLMLLRTNIESGNQNEALLNLQGLNRSVDDILTISDQLKKEELTLVDVILISAELCDTYRSIYPNIIFACNEEEEIYIMAKPRWIKRAISNLIDNAIKYGQNQTIEVQVKRHYGCAVIHVKDYGIGIEQEQQERIFEHNYRIDELKKDGYGIGLSLVQHVCYLCKGFVYCESSENGTTFYLSFQEIQ